jgi:ABC-type transporter Mla subunit MlaD
MSRKPPRPGDHPLAAAALELVESVESLERISGRVAELDLPDWKAIARAGELLSTAIEAHQRFVTALASLSEGVAGMRDRHNVCAERLAQETARLQKRREDYASFEQRFQILVGSVRETDALLKAIPPREQDTDPTAHLAAVSAAFGAVREKLSAAAAAAAVLGAEARAAAFQDLGQQAEGLRQQLEAMSSKVAKATPEA